MLDIFMESGEFLRAPNICNFSKALEKQHPTCMLAQESSSNIKTQSTEQQMIINTGRELVCKKLKQKVNHSQVRLYRVCESK